MMATKKSPNDATSAESCSPHEPLYTTERRDLTESLLATGKALYDADVDENDVSQEASEEGAGLAEPLLRHRNIARDERREQSPRILDRDGAFHQSRGKWSVQRRSRDVRVHHAPSNRCRVPRILDPDWFHNLAYKPTLVLMGILFLIYALTVFFFAFVYLGVSKLGAPANGDDGSIHHSFCGMDINNHMEALYFSLSTMTTIGYGVSDYYFGDCWTPLLLVLWQSCTAITFSAVAIGLLFQRISRGQKRSKTILFSDKAVVRRVKGVPYLMFRVGELRRHHLIEASIRAYCLRHERLPLDGFHSNGESLERACDIETTHFIARHMELAHPDETLGSHILMSLPQVIVHRLDEKSPLIPPQPVWYDAGGHSHRSRDKSNNSFSYENLENFLFDRDAEIIVLLEGTDELTGSALQARHSYRADDIAWDYKLAPCVFPVNSQAAQEDERSRWAWLGQGNCEARAGKPACIVDFANFHDIVRVAPNCDACAFVPQ